MSTEQIKVSVVEFTDRKHYQMQYRDPSTRRKITRSTGVERTGRQRERTAAEKAAGKWEDELRDGRYAVPSRMTWEDFKDRHENEAQACLADETCKKFLTTFKLVDEILKPVYLRDVTAEAISRWTAKLQANRADTTVAVYCRHLRAALYWAAAMKFIREAPRVKVPKGARGETLMKGRPITGEEFDRMLAVVGKVVRADVVPVWQRFLKGLWWSGLRLGEALRLSWEPTASVAVLLQPGSRAVVRFKAAGQKARRDELWACPPEFAEMLEATPESDRVGLVFKLPAGSRHSGAVSQDRAGRVVSAIGEKAGVIVDPDTQKPATAHDFRRAFGTRWSKRLMPASLKRLMRHSDIGTTMKYYVQTEAEDMAAELWAAVGNTKSNSGQKNVAFARETAE